MAFGVTPQGFVKKRLSDIKLEIENSLRADLGNQINLLPESVFSQLVGVYAERESKIWELAEAVYNSGNPDAADGVSLINIGALTNVTKLEAKKSLQQSLHLFGAPGTLVPANTQVSVQGSPTSTFKTLIDVTLVAGQDEVQTITPSAVPAGGSFRFRYRNETTVPIAYNANAATIQAALNSLAKLEGVIVTGSLATSLVVTFGGASGKINQPMLEVDDNTLVSSVPAPITFVSVQTTAGIPQGLVDAEASNEGPVSAPAYSLNVIDTPVAGLTAVLNTVDAVVGRDIETDNEFRIRRRQASKGQGKAVVEGIRSALLSTVGVSRAVVFTNRTLATDVNGLPPKSVRAYVQGGNDQDIWDTLRLSVGAGIETDGDEVGNSVDNQGITHVMKFSRLDEVEIFIKLELTTDPALFPVNGDELARAALADYINGLQGGDDVIVYPKLIATLNSIPGIEDLQIGVDDSPNPAYGTDDNIVIAINQIARVADPDTDIEVNVV